MLLASLILAAAAPLSQGGGVEVSPEVAAVAGPHGISLPPEAIRKLEKLEAAGDKSAAALLGEYYMYRGGADDWIRACDYSEKAGGISSAVHNLGTCYFHGTGRPRDLVKARASYGQASDMGFAKAACALGNMLIDGQGGEKDLARGLDLCRRGADAGDPDAQTDYGGYLLTGRHIAKDAVLARRYLTLAAEKRQRNAAFLLGQIYWNGDGVDKDGTEAARWWKIAFEAGRSDAAYMLGVEAASRIMAAVEAARPIPADALADAEKWLEIAEEKASDVTRRNKAAELWEGISAIAAAASAAQAKR